MSGKNQHVVPTGNGKWGVCGEGNQRLPRVTHPQAESIEIGKEIAKNQGPELLIHGKNSYGNDPCPPRDKEH